jgi:hypothetical protein
LPDASTAAVRCRLPAQLLVGTISAAAVGASSPEGIHSLAE